MPTAHWVIESTLTLNAATPKLTFTSSGLFLYALTFYFKLPALMDSAAVNDDVPPPYDGPATTPEYTPSKSPFAGETDAKAHQEELAKEESVFLPARPRRRASLWPSPARILSSALSVCRR